MARGQTLEGVVTDVVRQLADQGGGGTSADDDAVLGMFSDEPDLVDQVVEAAMGARERDPLRRAS